MTSPDSSPEFRLPGRHGLAIIIGYCLLASLFWLLYPASFIADDSYFYPVIARNLALTGHQTFNGLYSANGFHPLWFYLLAGYSWVIKLISKDLLFNPAYAVPLSAALITAGAVNLYAAARSLGFSAVVTVLVPVAFLFSFRLLYSEAHAQFFCLGLLARLVVSGDRNSLGRNAWIGAAAGLLFLSRLDTVFLVAALYVWMLMSGRGLARVVVSGAVCLATVAPYLIHNYFTFCGLVPISGWIKSTFPAIHLAGIEFLHPYDPTLSGYQVIFGIAPITASAMIAWLLRKDLSGLRGLLWVFMAGALMHWAQVSFFTTGYTVLPWYYVVPMVLAGLVAGLLVSRAKGSEALSLLIAAAVLAGSGAVIAAQRVGPGPGGRSKAVSLDMAEYLDRNHITGQTILLSDWPGTTAFFTDNRIISADMLTANRCFFKRMAASGNALQFLADYCRGQGRPLAYIIYRGGPWLVPAPDRQSLIYYNPKLAPLRSVPFGRLQVGKPIHVEQGWIVWKLGP